MTREDPIACSLEEADLARRLAEIAEIGARSLIARDREGGRHRLRFRADARTRKRLAEIVDAEESCCSFLGLSLAERPGELVLTIDSPSRASQVADGLAAAFERSTTVQPDGAPCRDNRAHHA